MILVDTNVLLDLVTDDAEWAEWSVSRLRECAHLDSLAINPIIYAELSLAFDQLEELDAAVADLELEFLELPKAALFLAARALLRYRRRGGGKANVLADFFIGAHAAVAEFRILTRDSRRYKSYFPTVQLIDP